jgi:hypothetical protein
MREEEGESTKWVVIRSELVHNNACIERMDVSCMFLLHHFLQHAPGRITYLTFRSGE